MSRKGHRFATIGAFFLIAVALTSACGAHLHQEAQRSAQHSPPQHSQHLRLSESQQRHRLLLYRPAERSTFRWHWAIPGCFN